MTRFVTHIWRSRVKEFQIRKLVFCSRGALICRICSIFLSIDPLFELPFTRWPPFWMLLVQPYTHWLPFLTAFIPDDPSILAVLCCSTIQIFPQLFVWAVKFLFHKIPLFRKFCTKWALICGFLPQWRPFCWVFVLNDPFSTYDPSFLFQDIYWRAHTTNWNVLADDATQHQSCLLNLPGYPALNREYKTIVKMVVFAQIFVKPWSWVLKQRGWLEMTSI